MFAGILKSISRVAILLTLALSPVALLSQVAPASNGTPHNDDASKWDIFVGYSYLSPHASVYGTSYDSVSLGEIASVSYFFNRYVGVQAEVGIHEWGTQNSNPPGGPGTQSNNDGFTTMTGGLILRHPMANWTPFVHVTGGEALVDGPIHNPFTWGPDVTFGGGLDYRLKHHLSIRLVQADYEYMHINFPANFGGSVGINAARISAGVVFNEGSIAAPPPVTLSCSVNPTTVFPGDPVMLTATAGGLNPKLNAVYSWSGSGVSGNGASAMVATGALAAGSYIVKCGVKEGKAGKEGLKPWESANSTTSFTVKQFDPPTISCSASPNTIKPGETSTITASGMSPQNRPLTYSYAATAGTVDGSGASATYNSTGAPAGVAGITCNVSDDKSQTATASTSVTITEPYKAPAELQRLEARLALHSVFFPTNLPTTANPKGGLVASQERTLTTLASDFKKYLEFKPEAHLTLTGHADVRGSAAFNQALSERRVERTKAFLVEKGVPEAEIETLGHGSQENLTAAQVKELVEENPDLSAAERSKVLSDLGFIVWAQNRRVDVTLSTTGEQSVRLYPFNAADSLTLIGKRSAAPVKKAAGGAVKKTVPPVKK